MRPSLDMPRGARYLVLALVSRPARAAVIAGHPRAYLAATLATAFRGLAVDPFAAQLHELALSGFPEGYQGTLFDDDCDEEEAA